MSSMFGALNRFISRLDAESPGKEGGGRSTHGAFGFQVLRNKDPEIPIEPWYDFIVGINGRMIDDPDTNLFAQEVRNCAGATVTLGIWTAKGSRVRSLQIQVPASPPSLGLSLQWTPLATTEDVWHILDVAPNSPADEAGLLPYSDYIIGTPEGIVRGESGLGELIEDHISRPLDLYIHNHEYNVTRSLTITPSRHWGGSGLLGCVLGYGALHRLPAPLTEPPQAPGETLFETARFSNEEDRSQQIHAQNRYGLGAAAGASATQDFITPATQFQNLASPPPPPTNRTPSPSKSKHTKAPSQAAVPGTDDMDAYFREGEEKSKELDGGATSSSTAAKSVPPPPKAKKTSEDKSEK